MSKHNWMQVSVRWDFLLGAVVRKYRYFLPATGRQNEKQADAKLKTTVLGKKGARKQQGKI